MRGITTLKNANDTATTMALAEQTAAPLVADCTELERENIALRDALRLIAGYGGNTEGSEMSLYFSGSWCAEQARTALLAVVRDAHLEKSQ